MAVVHTVGKKKGKCAIWSLGTQSYPGHYNGAVNAMSCRLTLVIQVQVIAKQGQSLIQAMTGHDNRAAMLP